MAVMRPQSSLRILLVRLLLRGILWGVLAALGGRELVEFVRFLTTFILVFLVLLIYAYPLLLLVVCLVALVPFVFGLVGVFRYINRHS